MSADQLSKYNPDGTTLGQDASDKISLYGKDPVVQPSAAAQAAITDGSGGTANAATGVATISDTATKNAVATIIAQTNALRAALVAIGAIKGSS